MQPKVPNDSDSAPLPIVFWQRRVAAHRRRGVGAVRPLRSGASLAAGGSPFPGGMTVLTQVSTKSARRPEMTAIRRW